MPVRAEPVDVNIVVRSGRSAHRIDVCGEIDLFTSDAVRETLTSVLARTTAQVELDLGGASFFSCAGVSALVIAKEAAGDRLVVVDASAPVRRVLDLVKLTTMLAGASGTPPATPHRR